MTESNQQAPVSKRQCAICGRFVSSESIRMNYTPDSTSAAERIRFIRRRCEDPGEQPCDTAPTATDPDNSGHPSGIPVQSERRPNTGARQANPAVARPSLPSGSDRFDAPAAHEGTLHASVIAVPALTAAQTCPDSAAPRLQHVEHPAPSLARRTEYHRLSDLEILRAAERAENSPVRGHPKNPRRLRS